MGRKEGDPDAPDAAVTLLRTRNLNSWLGTRYTPEEVADMGFDGRLMEALIVGLDEGLYKKPKDDGKPKPWLT